MHKVEVPRRWMCSWSSFPGRSGGGSSLVVSDRYSLDSRGRAGSALETRLIFFALIFRVRRQFSPIVACVLGVSSHGPAASSTMCSASLLLPGLSLAFRLVTLRKSAVERLSSSDIRVCCLTERALDPRGREREPVSVFSYLRPRGSSGSRLKFFSSRSRSRTRKASAPLCGRYR